MVRKMDSLKIILVLLLQAVIYGTSERENCAPNATPPDIQVNTTEILAELRALFSTAQVSGSSQAINAYIIPSEDAHKSEYPSEYDKRRGFISGFTGSAGVAVVTETKAALWTDGRYYLEAEEVLDCNWIFMKDGLAETPSITDWLIAELSSGSVVGASPKLLDSSLWKEYDEALDNKNISLVGVDDELVDEVWNSGDYSRPAQPNSDIFVLDMQYAGRTWQDKIGDVRAKMEEAGTEALVVTGLDETAWLFNLRADDISYNPVFISFAIVDTNKVRLYILSKNTKIPDIQEHLNIEANGTCKTGSTEICAEIISYSEFYDDVQSLGATVTDKIWIGYFANYAIYSGIPEDKIYQKNTPIALLKAMKNSVEQQGMINAYNRDSVALILFLEKLEKEVKAGEKWTEISAADDLEDHRRAQDNNKGLSFTTISASGPNGAIIHYSPTAATDRDITTSEMYLLDSGGQYLDGTTDVTRTFHYGTPTDYQKECYTLVLMASIELAMLKWPENEMYGRDIDVMARAPIWNVGLRYRHGTGHGIGAFLSVHEGPGRIRYGYRYYEEMMYPGMYFSDEPGYYEDGEFGIRLETIVMVDKVKTKYNYQNTTFLGFKVITYVPFEPNLINYEMLSANQIVWLNDYHVECMAVVGKILKDGNHTAAYAWMEARTAPITTDPPETATCKPTVDAAHKPTMATIAAILIVLIHTILL